MKFDTLKTVVEECEQKHLLTVVSYHNGDMVTAAKVLGISLATIYRRMEKYDFSYQKLINFKLNNTERTPSIKPPRLTRAEKSALKAAKLKFIMLEDLQQNQYRSINREELDDNQVYYTKQNYQRVEVKSIDFSRELIVFKKTRFTTRMYIKDFIREHCALNGKAVCQSSNGPVLKTEISTQIGA